MYCPLFTVQGGPLSRRSLSRGSLSRGLCPGGLCPGISVQGYLSREVSVRETPPDSDPCGQTFKTCKTLPCPKLRAVNIVSVKGMIGSRSFAWLQRLLHQNYKKEFGEKIFQWTAVSGSSDVLVIPSLIKQNCLTGAKTVVGIEHNCQWKIYLNQSLVFRTI